MPPIWRTLIRYKILDRFWINLEQLGAQDFDPLVVDEVIREVQAIQIGLIESNGFPLESVDRIAQLLDAMVLYSGEVQSQALYIFLVLENHVDDGPYLATREGIRASKNEHIVDWILSRKLVLLGIEHPILLDKRLVHEIVLPDKPMKRRQEDPHSVPLVEEAGSQVVDQVVLSIRHQQAVEIVVHELVKSGDLLVLLEHLSVTPGYCEQAPKVLGISAIFAF